MLINEYTFEPPTETLAAGELAIKAKRHHA
jgi:hypothetical protein